MKPRSSQLIRVAALGLVATIAGCTPTLTKPGPTVTPTPVVTLAPGSVVHDGDLTVCMVPGHAPQVMTSGDQLVGTDPDLARAIASRLGLALAITSTTDGQIRQQLDDGKCDVAMSAIRSGDPAAASLGTVPYLQVSQVLLQTKSSSPVAGQNDLCGKSVGVLDGSDEQAAIAGTGSHEGRGLSEACTASGKPAITALAFNSPDSALASVIGGSVVGWLVDSPLAGFEVQQHADQLTRVDGVTMNTDTEVIVIRAGAGQADTINAIGLALAAMEKDGTYQRTLQKYGVQP